MLSLEEVSYGEKEEKVEKTGERTKERKKELVGLAKRTYPSLTE